MLGSSSALHSSPCDCDLCAGVHNPSSIAWREATAPVAMHMHVQGQVHR